MTVSLVGTAETGTSPGSPAAIAVNKPAGTASGDVLIAVITQNGTTLTVPSGFTLVAEETGIVNTDFTSHVYSKVAGGSEPATYTFTKGDTTGPGCVTVSAWRGVDNGSPINISTSVAEAGDPTEPPDPTLATITTETSRVLYVRACRASQASPVNFSFTDNSGTDSEVPGSEISVFSGGTISFGHFLMYGDNDIPPTFYTSVVEPSSLRSPDTPNETDNIYFLVALESEHHIAADNFNRPDEELDVSSSGRLWSNVGPGLLGVVNNQCKLIG